MGAGRVGLNLATSLIKAGIDVSIIERDPKLCSNAANELDALVIAVMVWTLKFLKRSM